MVLHIMILVNSTLNLPVIHMHALFLDFYIQENYWIVLLAVNQMWKVSFYITLHGLNACSTIVKGDTPSSLVQPGMRWSSQDQLSLADRHPQRHNIRTTTSLPARLRGPFRSIHSSFHLHPYVRLCFLCMCCI